MKLKLALVGVILFTLSVTFLVTTMTDAVYMWSDSQTGGNPVAALQLVFLVAYALFVIALFVIAPGLVSALPFKPIGFLVAAAVVGYVSYLIVGIVASGG